MGKGKKGGKEREREGDTRHTHPIVCFWRRCTKEVVRRCHPVVPTASVLLRTIGDRSFHVTAARAWNSLPPSVTSAFSLTVFKRQVNAFLFDNSFSLLYILLFGTVSYKIFCLCHVNVHVLTITI